MSAQQQLDERARRGAAHVWAEANRQIEPQLAQSPPRLGRIGYVMVVVAVLAGTIGALRQVRFVETELHHSDVPAGERVGQSTEQADEPAPILIADMTLDAVRRPWVPGSQQDAQEVLVASGQSPHLTQVFANERDPFGGPILVIESYEGGGMQPWGINLEPFEVEGFASGLTRPDGVWTLDPESGLVEVASIQSDDESWFTDGWQFDFRSGSDEATLQSAPSRDGVC